LENRTTRFVVVAVLVVAFMLLFGDGVDVDDVDAMLMDRWMLFV